MEESKKISFKEWFENLWYHYKWVIILGGIMVVFLIVSLVQCTAKKDIDINILHVGPMTLSHDATELLKDNVASFSDDYTGDGEINVAIHDITVNKFGNDEAGGERVNYDVNGKGMQQFQTEIRAGKAVIYALDEEFFEICVQEGILTPFDQLFSKSEMPENVIDGYGVKISELDAYKLEGFSELPEGAILCIRRSPENDELTYGRNTEIWEGNRDTLVSIIKYKAPKTENQSENGDDK